MVTQAVTPRAVRVLQRGNWLDDSGEVVRPAVPEFLGQLNVGDRRANRLDLADWLTDPKAGVGGLTARVFVNRLWYLFYRCRTVEEPGRLRRSGRAAGPPGVARQPRRRVRRPANPDHRGCRQTPPLPPPTLGHKPIVRLLVTSRAYRQSSLEPPPSARRDTENRLYARQTRSRLPAEAIRDNALSLAGLLVLDVAAGRQAVPAGRVLPAPELPEARVPGRQGQPAVAAQRLHPLAAAVPAPDAQGVRRPEPEECTTQRPRSNTPLAALVLLNDPTFVEAARVFAQRVMTKGDDGERIGYAFRQATSRKPDDVEMGVLRKLLEKEQAQYRADPKAAGELVRVRLAPVPKDADVRRAGGVDGGVPGDPEPERNDDAELIRGDQYNSVSSRIIPHARPDSWWTNEPTGGQKCWKCFARKEPISCFMRILSGRH